GNRDIADNGDAEQGLDVRVVRMRLQRIPQEHQQVDLALGDAGADLLVAAVRAAAEAGDRQPELLLQEVAGGGRREQLVTGQQVQVVPGPLEHVPLLVVVRDHGNPPPPARRRVVGHEIPLRPWLPGSVPGWLRTPPDQMSGPSGGPSWSKPLRITPDSRPAGPDRSSALPRMILPGQLRPAGRSDETALKAGMRAPLMP